MLIIIFLCFLQKITELLQVFCHQYPNFGHFPIFNDDVIALHFLPAKLDLSQVKFKCFTNIYSHFWGVKVQTSHTFQKICSVFNEKASNLGEIIEEKTPNFHYFHPFLPSQPFLPVKITVVYLYSTALPYNMETIAKKYR